MPRYTNAIPEETRGYALPIRRTPPFARLVAIVTSPDLLGCYTHYYKGRTQPCELPNCEAHEAGIPFRWHAYFAAYDTRNSLHFVMEVTAAGAERFVEYRDVHGTLRGCAFCAERLNKRSNGRVLVQTKPADLTAIVLPNAPDLPLVLSTLWNLKNGSVQQANTDPERGHPSIEVNP